MNPTFGYRNLRILKKDLCDHTVRVDFTIPNHKEKGGTEIITASADFSIDPDHPTYSMFYQNRKLRLSFTEDGTIKSAFRDGCTFSVPLKYEEKQALRPKLIQTAEDLRKVYKTLLMEQEAESAAYIGHYKEIASDLSKLSKGNGIFLTISFYHKEKIGNGVFSRSSDKPEHPDDPVSVSFLGYIRERDKPDHLVNIGNYTYGNLSDMISHLAGDCLFFTRYRDHNPESIRKYHMDALAEDLKKYLGHTIKEYREGAAFQLPTVKTVGLWSNL